MKRLESFNYERGECFSEDIITAELIAGNCLFQKVIITENRVVFIKLS